MTRAGNASLEADMRRSFSDWDWISSYSNPPLQDCSSPARGFPLNGDAKSNRHALINFLPTAELEANRRSDHFSEPAEFSPLVPSSGSDRSDRLAPKPAVVRWPSS